MGSNPKPVDYAENELAVGQTVAFIDRDQDRRDSHRLYTGVIKLVAEAQIAVQSGNRLFIVEGHEDTRSRMCRFWTIALKDA